ncbi:glycosyltransferase [Lutibacter flavus]|uniref:Glycosyltransferase like family protein n=1 Tax=Lutibacter flavus TaxID=691689 RepID=A0A238VR24_9FLAO|nr:glycosyltransferase [Lutibacter flavus]SNR36604.1 Glycosyltransferase like family protein [Lutibacter flavus]
MISIVICSKAKKINSNLSENIKSTVGCEYELIVIDNSKNRYSIFEAYNIGIEKSKGLFLCFIHDDVLFHTQKWGIKINEIFQSDNKIGLIGIAGAKMKTKMPSAWWDCEEKYRVINILQHFPNKIMEHWSTGFANQLLEEVVVIDGVFMAWRKDDEIKFNEKLHGFHNYDLNLAFECKRFNYKIVVTNQILLEHFSKGNLDKSWYESTIKLHNFYKNRLPLKVIEITENTKFQLIEFKNGVKFLNKLIDLGLIVNAIKIWGQLIFVKPISKYHINFIKNILKI